MAHDFWLANAADSLRHDTIARFDPRYWTINFPRPMMASLTTPAADTLAIDCAFHNSDDLCGAIWSSEDSLDHPLLRYATRRDYRGMSLRFRWQASGAIKPLDAVFGPTLTIEGRDAGGQPRTWYVRLWNYATGTPTDAAILLDFDALEGGFLLPAEADPVWAGDIDRMFVSLVPLDYTGAPGRLAAPQDGRAVLSGIACDGTGAVLPIGDACIPPHGINIANGYDDTYNLTPARILHGMLMLGYRGRIDHYVGMSHFPRLLWDAGEAGFRAQSATPLNAPAQAWHADFFRLAAELGYEVVLSLSFELFDAYCWQAWKQRAHDGSPAQTGYTPPSTLLSPCNGAAMAYLQAVALAFAGLAAAAGLAVRFQVGEPWWWSGLPPGRAPCFYDAATLAAYPAETGRPVPTRHQSATEAPDTTQELYLDWLADKLSAATAALAGAVKAAHPGAETSILVYTPQIIDAAAPLLVRANLPAGWAWPAFDRLQLEDYDHVTADDRRAHADGLAQAQARLGYPLAQTDYFAGFVPEGQPRDLWRRIHWALGDARARGFADLYAWAFPQVQRDGFTLFPQDQETDVPAFHDVLFPWAVAQGAEVSQAFSTTVVETASGFESRNGNWADARLRYDAGLGVRSEADLAAVLRFHRARGGRAHAFRFRDPLDHASALLGEPVTPLDQRLGTGDGLTLRFALVKRYGDAGGEQVRRITRPEATSVCVAVNGVEQASGWTLDGAEIVFDAPPAPNATVTAGFMFDVPVRFADDQIALSLATYRAGEAPNIPLIEVREA